MTSVIRDISSPSWPAKAPRLSVLIPFYKDNPCALIIALDAQVIDPKDVEILLYDDGTDDPLLGDDIKRCLSKRRLPVRVMSNIQNHGRSAARNALQEAARSEWILFLDADMRPVTDDFLKTYLAHIDTNEADILFGGFTVEEKAADKDQELHRALSDASDCLSAEDRQIKGPQFVATSNLCVRKSVLTREPFDPGFSGWGWEDSEWAARVAKRYTLRHIDNPALHLGLETTDTLLRRFASSGANYARFTHKHPQLAKSLALYRLSKTLGKIPLQSLARPALKLIVKTHSLPIKLRLLALKLWRASHYADALKAPTTPLNEAAA